MSVLQKDSIQLTETRLTIFLYFCPPLRNDKIKQLHNAETFFTT